MIDIEAIKKRVKGASKPMEDPCVDCGWVRMYPDSDPEMMCMSCPAPAMYKKSKESPRIDPDLLPLIEEVERLKKCSKALAHREKIEEAGLNGMKAYLDGVGEDACQYEDDYRDVWLNAYAEEQEAQELETERDKLKKELEEEFQKRKLAEKLLEIREATLEVAYAGQNDLRSQCNRLKKELEEKHKRAQECLDAADNMVEESCQRREEAVCMCEQLQQENTRLMKGLERMNQTLTQYAEYLRELDAPYGHIEDVAELAHQALADSKHGGVLASVNHSCSDPICPKCNECPGDPGYLRCRIGADVCEHLKETPGSKMAGPTCPNLKPKEPCPACVKERKKRNAL